MENQDLINIMESRAAEYNMIARLYRKEVDQELLGSLKKMHWPQNTGSEIIDEAYRGFHHYLCNAWERTLNELAIDYARIFLGNGLAETAAAYPFESVYTSPRRLMMQEARDQVLAIYRSVGIGKSESWPDYEDHLALELEFEQILCQRTADALRANDDEVVEQLLTSQYNFLTDHLMNWVPSLLNDMTFYVETEFYQSLIALTRGFLDEEQQLLEDLLSETTVDQDEKERAVLC